MMTRMIHFFVVVLWLTASMVDASSDIITNNNDSSNNLVIDESNNRDLQTNTIINAACNLVSRLLPGDFLCECAVTVGFIFVCEFQSQFCLGPESTGYCSIPSVQGDVRLLRRTLAFEFCLNDATNGGVAAPGVCFDIGGQLDAEDTNSFRLQPTPANNSPKAVTKIASKFSSLLTSSSSSSSSSSPPPPPPTSQPPTKLLDCVGASDDAEHIPCNSCQLCNNNTGYMFDCTNINELLIQSTCTPLSILTNLRDPDQNIQFFPKLDAFD